MRYYIIAGEASGDLHGSNLIKELQRLDNHIQIRCWGGDKMQATGATLVKHYKELAFMGFVEVLMNLRTIFHNLKICKEDILAFHPDTLILIDYPGFNLRIAEWAKKQGIKVVYYISPQVWAWKESRVKMIRNSVDKMIVILPFEKDFYKKWDYEVEYVGHPLVKVIDDFKANNHVPSPFGDKNLIAILPGSRRQEISVKLPVMLRVAKHFPEYQFIVAKAPSIEDEFYHSFLADYSNVTSISGQTYELLSMAKAAIVTSGTATLEAALFNIPEVICYKGSPVSYQIAKRLIKVKYICLVNLIMDKVVVKELIQHDFTEANITKELGLLLNDEQKLQQINSDYTALKTLLSHGGNASANAAKSIYRFLMQGGISCK